MPEESKGLPSSRKEILSVVEERQHMLEKYVAASHGFMNLLEESAMSNIMYNIVRNSTGDDEIRGGTAMVKGLEAIGMGHREALTAVAAAYSEHLEGRNWKKSIEKTVRKLLHNDPGEPLPGQPDLPITAEIDHLGAIKGQILMLDHKYPQYHAQWGDIRLALEDIRAHTTDWEAQKSREGPSRNLIAKGFETKLQPVLTKLIADLSKDTPPDGTAEPVAKTGEPAPTSNRQKNAGLLRVLESIDVVAKSTGMYDAIKSVHGPGMIYG